MGDYRQRERNRLAVLETTAAELAETYINGNREDVHTAILSQGTKARAAALALLVAQCLTLQGNVGHAASLTRMITTYATGER